MEQYLNNQSTDIKSEQQSINNYYSNIRQNITKEYYNEYQYIINHFHNEYYSDKIDILTNKYSKKYQDNINEQNDDQKKLIIKQELIKSTLKKFNKI